VSNLKIKIGDFEVADKINKKDLIERIANKTKKDLAEVELIVDATLDEIYQLLKNRETVSIRNFGKFYIRERSSGTIFKFDPSQKLRAIFGWASTYKGEL
jgi:DNA-binding protein HU-beta